VPLRIQLALRLTARTTGFLHRFLWTPQSYLCYRTVVQRTKRRRLISQITTVWIVLGASLVLGASGNRQTFALPNSILLFGNYEDLRVVTPDREQMLRPPIHQGYNAGYFASPSISPRGDSVAWGFAVDFQKGRRPYPARFALGVYSLSREQWKHFGDFDDIGTTAYSSDGSKIAFVARTNGKQQLLIFDVAKESWTTAPYPTGGLRSGAAMSWSPDDKRLVVEVQHGGLPYRAAQMSKPDPPRNSVIAVLELETGNVRVLGEGSNPGWSPDGQWIAYYDPEAAKCLLVHPDGTGNRVVKRFKRSRFYFFA
jgi:hypothetical protein